MVNEKGKQADFFRKLCAGGFRDQDKGIEGGHRNPRWKKPKKKAEEKRLAEESARWDGKE